MTRATWRSLGAALLLLLPLGASARDAERDDPGAAAPVEFRGETWRSQRAFSESGRRCSTRPVDEEEAAFIEEEAASLLAQHPGRSALANGGTINVYFHVINNGSTLGQGNIPDSQINAQM